MLHTIKTYDRDFRAFKHCTRHNYISTDQKQYGKQRSDLILDRKFTAPLQTRMCPFAGTSDFKCFLMSQKKFITYHRRDIVSGGSQ